MKRYPRTIENSVRRKDERRKLKRAEKKQRKELERKQKLEEIKRLKNLKKKEIFDKMNRLKSVAGEENLRINIDDLNADFDPKEYDRRMNVRNKKTTTIVYILFFRSFVQELFNDEYYQKGVNEEEKPDVSDEELQGLFE